MDVEIVYEDEYCFVVNKPPNVVVHHSKYVGDLHEYSLVELLNQLNIFGFPVHRLDRKTSGLILFSREKSNVSIFQKLFDNKLIGKKYIALLRGFVNDSGLIDSPIKNERGNYKEALTMYKTIFSFEWDLAVKPYSTCRYSIVEFEPVTGRMHQLRVHANKIAHPIIGDPKYGNRHHNHFFEEYLGDSKLFLHAIKLSFIHPIFNSEIKLKVLPPLFWKNLGIINLESLI